MENATIIFKNEMTDADSTPNVANPTPNNDNGGDSDTWRTAVKQTAKQIAKVYSNTALVRQAVMPYVSVMQAREGNSYAQDKINLWTSVSQSVLTTAISFAINPVAGMTTIAGGLLNLAFKYDQYNYERRNERIALDESRQRLGYTARINRSRHGQNGY